MLKQLSSCFVLQIFVSEKIDSEILAVVNVTYELRKRKEILANESSLSEEFSSYEREIYINVLKNIFYTLINFIDTISALEKPIISMFDLSQFKIDRNFDCVRK